MNFTIKELNELLYSLGTTASKGMMVNKELNSSLIDKLYNELSKKLEFYDENGYEQTDEDYKGQFNDWKNETPIESSHYVSNEEADEDFLSTLQQDEQRYEASHMTTSFPIVDPFTSVSEDFTSAQNNEYDRYESSVEKDYDNHLSKLKQRGYITQALLDYVDKKGAVSYSELQTYYRQITGSNSFSHILDNLRTPYKNRKTQRYIAKEGKRYSDAKYVIKIANSSNWVEIDY